MPPVPMEPTAELRAAANHLRQMYVALIDQGFTSGEALTICGYAIAANAAGGQ